MAEHTTLESLIAGNIGDTYTDGNVKYTLGQNKVFKERALPKSNELTEHEQNNSAHVKGITNFLAAQGWATSNPGEISSAGGKELQYSGGTFTRVINEIEESFTIAPINPITFKPIFKDGTSAGPDLIELDNTRYEPAEDGVLADVGPEGTDTNDGTAQLLFLDPATGTFYAQYGTQRYASTAAGSYQWHQYERPSPAMSGNIWLAAIILDEDAANFTTAALARIMPVRSSGGGGVPPLLSGATDAQDGGPGLVPAPLIGDEAKFLRGNGAWDNITTDDLPLDSVSGLEVLGNKLHAVYTPRIGKLCDLTPNRNDLTQSLGTITYDADGNAMFTGAVRADLPTDGTGSGLWIYARVKYDAALDAPNDDVAVFGANDTFFPIAQGTSNSGSTNISRTNGANNANVLRIDGVEPANRLEAFNAINTGDFVIIEIDNFPNGSPLSIGDHIQNSSYDFDGTLRDMVILNEAPTPQELKTIRAALANGITILNKPSDGEVTTTAIYDGVMVDAAPAWTDGVTIANGATEIVQTGVDLNTVDQLVISFQRSNDTWPTTRTVRVDKIQQGILQGEMIHHFDNDYMGIREISPAQFAAGEIPFSASTGTTTFGFEITCIEFRKRAVGSSPLIGFKVEGPPNLEGTIKGLLAVTARTVTNGAVDNPIFAARHPALVSGNDIVIPSDYEGAFSRNLGGNAAAFDVFQNDATAVNGLAGTSRFNRGENTSANGGAFRLTGSGSEITINSTLTGDNETRPNNYALQWYFIMDDYVDPTSGGAAGTIEDPKYVGEAGNPVFLSSWVNFNYDENNPVTFQGLRFWKDGDIVHIEGLVKNDGPNIAPVGLFILPEGYRPTHRLIFSGVSNSAPQRFDILADGTVTLTNFTRTVGAWGSVNCSFRV